MHSRPKDQCWWLRNNRAIDCLWTTSSDVFELRFKRGMGNEVARVG